jgi:ribosomal protein S12 methylthiotransferase accessory factor YcaO
MNLFGEEVSAPKTYFRGTHRSVPPAETLRRFSPHLPALGITRLADITGLDAIGLPVYVAIRPNARNLSTSQGKGFDHDSAKASAMMESIESWHGECPDLPLLHDSHRSLALRAMDVRPPRDGDAELRFPAGVPAQLRHEQQRPLLGQPTFEGDVMTLLDRLQAVGVTSAVVVDLSRAQIGIPVVKVVVPGLEGHSQSVTYRPGARATALAKQRSA